MSSSLSTSSSKPANKESKSLWSNWPPSKGSPSIESSSKAIVSSWLSKAISSSSSKSSKSSSSWITSSSSASRSSENRSSWSSSFSDKSIESSSSSDNSSSSESSSSRLNSSSNVNSLSTTSFAGCFFALASTFFSILSGAKFSLFSLLFLRLNKIATKDKTNNAGKVAINAMNHELDIKLPSSSSAFCFSINNDCSLASAFVNSSCCSEIMSSICNLISLLLATSLCITPSWSLKLVRRSRSASFSFNKLCRPSIESKTSFWIVVNLCCCVLSMACNWTLISDFAASKSFLLTEASSGFCTFLGAILTTLATFFCHALSSLRDFCCALSGLIARIISIGGSFKYWPLIIWFKLFSLKESGLFSYKACMTW